MTDVVIGFILGMGVSAFIIWILLGKIADYDSEKEVRKYVRTG